MENPSRALQHCRRTLDLLRDEGDSDMKCTLLITHAVAFAELAAKTRDGEGTRSLGPPLLDQGGAARQAGKGSPPATILRNVIFPNEAGVIVSRLPW